MHLPPTLPNAARGLANTIQHINLTPLSATERQQFPTVIGKCYPRDAYWYWTRGGIGLVYLPRGNGKDVPHGKAALLVLPLLTPNGCVCNFALPPYHRVIELRFLYAPNGPATVYGPDKFQ